MVVETNKGKLPVRFGMNALAKYGDLTGKTMNEVFADLGKSFNEMKLSDVIALVYVAIVDGARHAGEECKVADIAEVGDMLDDDGGLLEKVFNMSKIDPGEKKESKKK